MNKKPKTTNEHIISIYGHIEGLKKSISNLKSNHIFHLHQDVSKLDEKLDKRFDTVINWLIYGLGGVIILLITQLLYNISK
jgi:hypothetical protein